MIKFDFLMSDVDGNNLMDVIQQSIADAHENALIALSENRTEEAAWFREHAVYLKGLKQIVSKGAQKIS